MRLGPGDAHLIPAGVRHRDDVPGSEGVRARWLHFTFRLLGGLDLFALLESPGYIPAAEAGEGREALREVIESYAAAPGANPLALVASRRQAVSRFLAFLVKVCRPRRDMGELVELSRRLQPALVRIHEHYAEPLGRDDLARLANLSRSRFHHLFRQLTGMGAIEYLKHRRLQAAQALLLTTDQPIKQVSAAVGYGDPFHFTRLFTAAIGCSPRDFRRRNAITPG
jgi:AraC-like DNA-binding protein